MLVDKGRVTPYIGDPPHDMIPGAIPEDANIGSGSLSERSDRLGGAKLRITGLRILEDDTEKRTLQCGKHVSFEVSYATVEELRKLRIHIVIDTPLGEHILYLGTDLVSQDFSNPPSVGKVTCHVPMLPLVPGSYVINLYCVANNNEDMFDGLRDAGRFEVIEGDYFGHGLLPPAKYARVLVPHEWALTQGREETTKRGHHMNRSKRLTHE